MMKGYNSYKETGIDFVSIIPTSWEAKRIRFGVKSLTGFAFKSNEYKSEGIKLVRGINVKEGVLNWDDTQYWDVVTQILKKYLLSAGDVLIQMDGSKVGKNYCIVKEADLPLLLLQRVTRLRTNKNLNSSFLYYTIASQNFFNWVSISKTDPLVPHITLKDIENYVIALPPLSEQTAIAEYLDAKTQAIDKKINLLTKKAETYKELRKSIINDAVCKGLDKQVELKESGIEWIGKIPEHWSNYRIDWITSITRGNTAFAKDELLDNGSYVALQYGKIYKVNEVDNTFNFYVNNEFYKRDQVVRHGDTILISTSETIEDLGHSCFYNREDLGLVGGEQVLLKPKRKLINEKYLYYFSNIFCTQLRKCATGLKVYRFGIDDLKMIFIAIPPTIQEQTAIANYLDEKTQKIDAIVSNIGKQIDTLKELRKTLINDVVTGKIKVVNN